MSQINARLRRAGIQLPYGKHDLSLWGKTIFGDKAGSTGSISAPASAA